MASQNDSLTDIQIRKSKVKLNFNKLQVPFNPKKTRNKPTKPYFRTKAYRMRSRESLSICWPLLLMTILVSITAKLIGKVEIPLFGAELEIMPIVWAIIIGSVISCQTLFKVPKVLQMNANAIMKMTLLCLMATLSFQVGPNIGKVLQSGVALIFQEAGHFFGTIILAFPLAMFLGMGKATIGATFSIDREASIAIVANKYGLRSAEYRGLLSMFVFGSLFGAVFISFVASISASLGIFSLDALALGSGIGSGSMMAAATNALISSCMLPNGVINCEIDPGLIIALAATANVITMAVGIYVGIYISLPLVDKIYHFFTRNNNSLLGRINDENKWANKEKNESFASKTQKYVLLADTAGIPKDYRDNIIYNWQSIIFINIVGFSLSLIVPDSKDYNPINAIICLLVIDVIVLISMNLAKLCHEKVPAVVFIVAIGAFLTSDFFKLIPPLHILAPVGLQGSTIDTTFFYDISLTIPFNSMTVLVMALAGLGIGKEIPLLKRIGWKIIPVGLVAIMSSFFFSVIIAEFTLGHWKLF